MQTDSIENYLVKRYYVPVNTLYYTDDTNIIEVNVNDYNKVIKRLLHDKHIATMKKQHILSNSLENDSLSFRLDEYIKSVSILLQNCKVTELDEIN